MLTQFRRFLIQGCGTVGILQRQIGRTLLTSPLTDIEIPQKGCLDFVTENFVKNSERAAIIDGLAGTRYTYAQLGEAIRNVSSGLVRHGLREKEVVCIFARNSPEFIFSLCGILAAGGIPTLASSASVPGDLAPVLQNTGTKFIITTAELLPTAQQAAADAAGAVSTIFVIGGGVQQDSGSKSLCSFDKTLLEDNGGASPLGAHIDVQPDDIALLPHSSGTTGFPKTVQLSHYNICANLAQTEAVRGPMERHVYIGLLPFYHIFGFHSLIGMPLYLGGTIVTLPEFKGPTFLGAIAKHRVSTLTLVPPLLLFLIHDKLALDYDLSSVRQVSSGAAPLTKNIEDAFRARFQDRMGDIEFLQGYGMTETGPVINLIPHRDRVLPGKEGSVGVLLPNMKAKVVDPDTSEELGPDQMGELFVQGPNVMRGYLNNPRATEEILDGAGWLRTGDMVYYDQDGYFYIVDRLKECIKYKAIQVAPAELEALLLRHPLIVDAAVVRQKDERAGEVPAAFIVPTTAELSEEEVRRFVAERVADYKQIRGAVRFVQSIPKSPSGKILRRELETLLV